MYEPFFGLSRRPFAAAADADCYFPASPVESARQTLFRAIDRGEGPGLLIGPAGSGKSLLLLVLAEQFAGRFEIALLANGGLGTRRELLRAILYELRLPCRDLDEGEMRLSLIDHLSADGQQEGMLLLIDEAHAVAFRLLEEIRLITNLIRDGQPKVRLVLAGSSALEERFASPRLDVFNQRIAARCYLESIDRGETYEYVKAQVAWAGGQPDRLFSADALAAIYQASQGVPRLINQVCDHALVLSSAAGKISIDKRAVEEAWADLQQLPTPWNRQPGAAKSETPAGSVIEFGVLADQDDSSRSLYEPSFHEADSSDCEADRRGYDSSVEIEINEQTIVDNVDLQECHVDMQFVGAASPSETELDFGEPRHSDGQNALGRLAHVEEQLAAIDIDLSDASQACHRHFQPVAALESAFNPFAEHFAEEEVILDPFAMTAGDALTNRPLVYSEEGRKLGALLRPLADNSPHAPPQLTVTPPDVTLETTGDGFVDEPIFRTVDPDGTCGPWNDADLPDIDASSEPAMIVIEDDPPPAHHVTVVRRNEYGQAFGNLRRR
jgi:type II secretory pathway predicted ATPase ExeA